MVYLLNAQFNVSLTGQIDYEQRINDIWGYAADDGTEYALVGTNTGFSIVSLADPNNPIELFFIPGQGTTWRDVKVWDKHAYVVCDACTEGILVVDLSELPESIDHQNVTETPIGTLEDAHNIWIDEFGYAYLCGSNLNRGAFVFDCFTDPFNPTYVSTLSTEYAHDIFVRNNLLYTSEIYAGEFCIYDVTDKNNPILQGCQGTEFAFTHNAWLSDDSKTLFTTDEREDASVGSYDVSDPTDIKELFQFRSLATIGQGTIPHNVHVYQDYLIISYYTDGCIIVDASKPDNLVEVGNFDTYLNSSFGYNGVWGAYPFLPSETILVTDRDNGLYVLSPNYQRAAFLEGKVTDAVNGKAINGALLNIVEFDRNASSNSFGEYKLGYPENGTYTLEVSAIGYEPKTLEAVLEQGELTILDVSLKPLIPFSFSGNVVDFADSQEIPFVKWKVENQDFTFEGVTDENGVFTIPEIFEGEYNLYVGKWGYNETTIQNFEISDITNGTIYFLKSGYQDLFNLDHEWIIGGQSFSGEWERGTPIEYILGDFNLNLEIVPSYDSNADLGNSCFITENNPEVTQGNIFGRVQLESPPMDMSDWINPNISFDYWFMNITSPLFGLPEGGSSTMEFSITNGPETVLLDEVTFDELGSTEWTTYTRSLQGLLEISDQMQFIIRVKTDIGDEITEGLFDNFLAWDSMVVSDENLSSTEQVNLFPNPANDLIQVKGLSPEEDHSYSVYSIDGKELVNQIPLSSQTKIDVSNLSKGVYLLKIKSEQTGREDLMKFSKF